MKKDLQNREIMKAIKHEEEKNIFNSLKVIYKQAIEVNNDLKLNVDEQQGDIKHLKEQCDIYDEDEVHEITADKNPMKNNKAVYVT